jgi:hypothetical protein
VNLAGSVEIAALHVDPVIVPSQSDPPQIVSVFDRGAVISRLQPVEPGAVQWKAQDQVWLKVVTSDNNVGIRGEECC